MNVKICDHQLFVTKIDTDRDANKKVLPNTTHATIVCAYCGHVRKLYTDGTVVVEKEYGEVKRKHQIP